MAFASWDGLNDLNDDFVAKDLVPKQPKKWPWHAMAISYNWLFQWDYTGYIWLYIL